MLFFFIITCRLIVCQSVKCCKLPINDGDVSQGILFDFLHVTTIIQVNFVNFVVSLGIGYYQCQNMLIGVEILNNTLIGIPESDFLDSASSSYSSILSPLAIIAAVYHIVFREEELVLIIVADGKQVLSSKPHV